MGDIILHTAIWLFCLANATVFGYMTFSSVKTIQANAAQANDPATVMWLLLGIFGVALWIWVALVLTGLWQKFVRYIHEGYDEDGAG